MTGTLSLTGRYYRQYPPGDFEGFAERPLTLGVHETAVLVVDIYGTEQPANRSFSGMGNQHSSSMAQQIISKRIKPMLDAARKVGLPVVYVANSAPRVALKYSAYWEQKWQTLHVDKDDLFSETTNDPLEYHHGSSDVLQYTDESRPEPGDYYVRKHTPSGFFDTRLDTLLRNLRIQNLVCAGFALDMCLGATMLDALWRNYRPVLLRDCTYAIELPEIDEPGSWTSRWITYVECAIGYTTTSDDFIDACARVGAAPSGPATDVQT
jgi:nicotinamidase-related amidase